MSKDAEIAYFANMSDAARDFVRRKPYSSDERGGYLVDFGQILSLIRPPPARLLDLGCGSGWTSGMFALCGYDTLGVDVAPAAIDIAREAFGATGARFEVRDFEALAFEGQFEVAVLYDALHHAEREEAVLAGVHRALAPGGEALIAEPGRGHAGSDLSRRAVEAHGVTERDMPPRRVAPILRRLGFEAVRVYPRARFQMYERAPAGGIARRFSALLGARGASLLKALKNSLLPGLNGVVWARKGGR